MTGSTKLQIQNGKGILRTRLDTNHIRLDHIYIRLNFMSQNDTILINKRREILVEGLEKHVKVRVSKVWSYIRSRTKD